MIEQLTALGPTAGAVVVVVLFLKFLGKRDTQMGVLMQNHFEHTYAEHQRITSVLEALRDALLSVVGNMEKK